MQNEGAMLLSTKKPSEYSNEVLKKLDCACVSVFVNECLYDIELVPLRPSTETVKRHSDTLHFPGGWLTIYIHEPKMQCRFNVCLNSWVHSQIKRAIGAECLIVSY